MPFPNELDITIKFYTGAGGTSTLLNTITCLAGQAYEWDGPVDGSPPVGTQPAANAPTYHSGAITAALSIILTASLYVDGVLQSAITATDIHIRTSLSS